MKKELVGELGLVLEPDLVSGLMVSHCMLQDHDFVHLLGLGVGKLALGNKGTDVGRQGMDTLVRELADIRQKLIPECSSALIIVSIFWCSGVMVPLSIRDWRVYLHPQTSSSAASSLCTICQPHQY